jgi:hypothetical protein
MLRIGAVPVALFAGAADEIERLRAQEHRLAKRIRLEFSSICPRRPWMVEITGRQNSRQFGAKEMHPIGNDRFNIFAGREKPSRVNEV